MVSPERVPDIDDQIAEISDSEEVSGLEYGLSSHVLHQNSLQREDNLDDEIAKLWLFTIKWGGRAVVLVALALGVSAAVVLGIHYLSPWEWLDPAKLGRITDFVGGGVVFMAASGIWQRFRV